MAQFAKQKCYKPVSLVAQTVYWMSIKSSKRIRTKKKLLAVSLTFTCREKSGMFLCELTCIISEVVIPISKKPLKVLSNINWKWHFGRLWKAFYTDNF